MLSMQILDEKDQSKIYRDGNDSLSMRHEQNDPNLPEWNPNYSMVSNDQSMHNESQTVRQPNFFQAFFSRVQRGVTAELDKIKGKAINEEVVESEDTEAREGGTVETAFGQQLRRRRGQKTGQLGQNLL